MSDAEDRRHINSLGWLHVLSQYTYHAEAMIKGTEKGLTLLRDAIDKALQEGTAEAEVFANDGEGYAVKVIRTNTVAGLGQPPYLADIVREMMWQEQKMVKDYQRVLYERKPKGSADGS